jgi:hypothetical protein
MWAVCRDQILRRVHRLELAAGDMRDAAGAAEWFAPRARTLPPEVARVVEAGIVVVYARPFTNNDIGILDRVKYAPRDSRRRELHELLIELRMKLHAHTDTTSLRHVIEGVVHQDQRGSAVEMVVETLNPREFEDVARLAREQQARFESAAAEARAKLGDSSKNAGGRVTLRIDPPTVP